jgi:hypothetical protein
MQKEIQEVELVAKTREMEFERLLNEERQKYFTESLKLTEVTLRFEDAEKAIMVREE